MYIVKPISVHREFKIISDSCDHVTYTCRLMLTFKLGFYLQVLEVRHFILQTINIFKTLRLGHTEMNNR